MTQTDEARAREIRKAITAQNWKHGGALIMDVDEAEALIIQALSEARREGAEQMRPRPLSEWHEDMGPALWWHFKDGKPTEAPYVGTPLDLGQPVEISLGVASMTNGVSFQKRITVGGWPGYHTHTHTHTGRLFPSPEI